MDEGLLNFSRVEEDPFAGVPVNINVTETSIHRSTFYIALSYAFLVAELANFLLGIASVVSDFLLLYFIFRYKRLRKSLNLYIANYAIMNLSYYLVAPVLLIFHVLFSLGYPYFYFMFCYVTMIEYTSLLGSFIFVTLLGLEWTFSVLKPNTLSKISYISKHKFLIIYLIILTLLILSCLGCFLRLEFLQNLPFYFMPLIVVSLIYMHYIRHGKILNEEQLKTEYALWIFTIALGCFIPIYLIDVLLIIFGNHISHTIALITYMLEYILAFVSTPTPVYILYYLIKWNKHFKMALDTTFKKSVRNYGADNLDDGSDNEEIVQDSGQKNVESGENSLSRPEIMVF